MQSEKSPLETVRVADSTKESWMSSFDMKSFPSLKDIGKTANLPVLHDRSFSRTAIAMGDTQKGAFQVLVDGVDSSLLNKDPRVEQLRRMMHKNVEVFEQDPKTKTLKLAPPSEGKVKEGIPGIALERSEKTPSGPVFASTVLADMKERAKGLPQHLKGRMKALEQAMETVRTSRRENKIGERDTMAAVADISEKAFLVAEGGKSEDQRRVERREGKVDSLFAASSHATREASRLGEEDKFKRGLVTDVMAKDQESRINDKRGLRAGDDYVGTSKRLARLGLIGQDDPRVKVDQNAVQALMAEPAPVKEKFEAMQVEEMTPSQGNIEQALKEKRKQKVEPRIEREKPPEGVAPTTYQQVGLSGQYLAAEISRDNKNAHDDKKRAAEIRRRHQDASKEKSTFAQAGYAEMAVLNGHKAGRDPQKTKMAASAVAVRANTGVQEVSRVKALQAQKKAVATKSAPQR